MIIMKTTENFEANNHAPRKSYSPDSTRLDASTHETGRPHDALQPDDDAQESASRFGSKKGEQTPDTPRVSAGHRIAKPVRNSLILLLLILLTAAGFAGWRYVESYQSTDDAEIDGHIHEISSRIQGSVARVSVEDNQHVKKGQLLVELDPRDFQVAVEQARASLDQAMADIKVSQQNHETAVANLRATEADNYRAQRDAERYRTLLTQQVVAQAEFDQYYATARTDAAKVNADRANSDSALRTIALKRAAAQAAQAALDQALLNLSYTKIYAPDDGVIGKKTVETGQRVDLGESLMAVVDVQDVWVTANFKENQLAGMRRGQRVTIHVDALDRDYRGCVEAMPGATGEKFSVLPPENATGNYVKVVQRLPVRIAIDQDQNPQHKLRPGMSVEPTVWLQSAPLVREENFARWWRGLK
jgi:membrane fusion protein (multidrug efflux system)